MYIRQVVVFLNKADKIFDLVHETLMDVLHPKYANVKDKMLIATMMESLSIITKGTRYEEDITKLLDVAEERFNK